MNNPFEIELLKTFYRIMQDCDAVEELLDRLYDDETIDTWANLTACVESLQILYGGKPIEDTWYVYHESTENES